MKTVASLPTVARQWHPTRNAALDPRNVRLGSTKPVWWKCDAGPDHEWRISPNGRTHGRVASGCPFCAGKRVSVTNSLASRFPQVALEWDAAKNGDLRPESVSWGSHRRAWWRCRRDPTHVWNAHVASRTSSGAGCPFCAGVRASTATHFAALHPELVGEWHPTKNGALKPEQFRPGSGRRVWWLCPRAPSHEWQTSIAHRTVARSGCPYCAGVRWTPEQSFLARYPEVAAEWHPTRNGALTPADVSGRSGRAVWWRCRSEPAHEWRTTVGNRTPPKNTQCPYCRDRRVSPARSLAGRFAEIAALWHPTRNGALTPFDVMPGSTKPVWWKCPKGPDHEWKVSPNARTSKGRGCPFCANRRASVTNSLAARFPAIAKEWHPKLNGVLTASHIAAGSYTKVWWQCTKDAKHEWWVEVGARTGGGRGCPFCARHRVAPDHSLARTHPALARQWHPTRNGSLTPKDVSFGSTAQVWWLCDKGRDHVWQGTPNNRSGGQSCPFCAGRRASVTNSLAARFPKLAAQWHPTKNVLRPNQVYHGTHVRAWWQCNAGPDHEWQAMVILRTRSRKPSCPFCLGRRPSVTNSLARRNPAVAALWHPTKNGALAPQRIAPGSMRQVWWKCERAADHEWLATPNQRTRPGGGRCPFCVHRRLSVTNILATVDPATAAEWHPTRNRTLTPRDVHVRSTFVVWWRCRNGPDHEWQMPVWERTKRKRRCPFCRGKQVSITNSLQTVAPHLAAEWHPTRNGKRTPADVIAAANDLAWWRCARGHAWRALVRQRVVSGRGCPACAVHPG